MFSLDYDMDTDVKRIFCCAKMLFNIMRINIKNYKLLVNNMEHVQCKLYIIINNYEQRVL